MSDEIEELMKKVDYLEGRLKVPDEDPYLETVKDSLIDETEGRDPVDVLNDFNQQLESILDSIGSYRETLEKAKKQI